MAALEGRCDLAAALNVELAARYDELGHAACGTELFHPLLALVDDCACFDQLSAVAWLMRLVPTIGADNADRLAAMTSVESFEHVDTFDLLRVTAVS